MNSIPRVIYQTWWTKALPPSVQTTVNTMMELNGGYDYRLYDDREMQEFVDRFHDPVLSRCFNSMRVGAAKADLWRYLVLYSEGGIYLDVDSVIHTSIDPLVGDDGCAVISRENNPGLFVQWCLMFPPRHPILKRCIDRCVENITVGKRGSVLEMTGPRVYSAAIVDHFGDSSVYHRTDENINVSKNTTGVRVYGHDYAGYAHFMHPNRDELYATKPHWTVQQQMGFSHEN